MFELIEILKYFRYCCKTKKKIKLKNIDELNKYIYTLLNDDVNGNVIGNIVYFKDGEKSIYILEPIN